MDKITYTGYALVPMGYQACPTDREEYKRMKQRERNKRHQDKIKLYTSIEKEPDDVSKVIRLLEIINPRLQRSDLRYKVKTLIQEVYES